MAKNEVIHIRLSPEVKAELQAVADKDDRTVSNYVLRLIQKDLEQQRKKEG